MKKILLIGLLLSFGFAQKEYDKDHIVERDTIYIKKFSNEIVSGKVFGMWGDMKVPLGVIKDGKKEGKWISWYKNGNKEGEGTFKDGKEDGLWTYWWKNGKKESEGTFKDGKEDGLWSRWSEDGLIIKNVCISTDFGIMILELYPEVAPKHVESFIQHVKNGYYNGTTFHQAAGYV
mgnify:CR=1 FL=1